MQIQEGWPLTWSLSSLSLSRQCALTQETEQNDATIENRLTRDELCSTSGDRLVSTSTPYTSVRFTRGSQPAVCIGSPGRVMMASADKRYNTSTSVQWNKSASLYTSKTRTNRETLKSWNQLLFVQVEDLGNLDQKVIDTNKYGLDFPTSCYPCWSR